MWLELAPLLELMYHIIGIQKMKTHIFIGMLINLWILFGVIKFNQDVSIIAEIHVANNIGTISDLLGDPPVLQQDNSSLLQCIHCYGLEIRGLCHRLHPYDQLLHYLSFGVHLDSTLSDQNYPYH